jgi:hypothetical protein
VYEGPTGNKELNVVNEYRSNSNKGVIVNKSSPKGHTVGDCCPKEMMIITLKGDNLLTSGRTLVDTESHLSLVRIGSLVRTHDIKECDVTLESVSGNEFPVIGSIVMPVYHENVEYKHNFIVATNLPENLDCLIGLDFMNKYDVGFIFRSGKVEVKIPLRIEKVVEIPIKENGDILVTKQEIKPGVFIADSLTTVRNDKIIACIMNNNRRGGRCWFFKN